MPYRRNRRRRARPRKNIFYRRGANKAFKLAKFAVSMLNSEKKYIDFSSNALSVPSTGTIQLLNPLIQGTTATTRVGNQIRVKSVNIRFNITIDASASPAQSFVRCMLLWDRQPNGALPALADILEDVSTPGMAINTPLERDFAFRFRVIKSKRYTVYADKPIIYLNWFKRLNKRVRYDDSNAGDITDIATNSLLFVLVSNEATNTPDVAFFSRVRFIDN